jgi:zinc transporter ZupT
MAIGAFSAISLPMGSLVALYTNPRHQVISILTAFGAGALIAALSLELVAPVVFSLHDQQQVGSTTQFFALLLGAIFGGLLFVILDQVVNAYGGFLRKGATSIAYFKTAERERQEALIRRAAQIHLLHNVSAEHINTLVSIVRHVDFYDGEVIAREDEEAGALYFVMQGTVSVTRAGSFVGELGQNDAYGITPLLTQSPNPATATAKGPVEALVLLKDDFEHLRSISSAFDHACRELSEQRLELLEKQVVIQQELTVKWEKDAIHALRTGTRIPTAGQLRRAKEEHGGAPLAIWLGILLDGIPESFVIGSGVMVLLQARMGSIGLVTFVDAVNFTLIAGLFLSNFPEALASSANMKLQDRSKGNIFLMWFSLMLMTAIGAGLGYLLAGVLSTTILIFAQGIAAGAMLTMIASTMIPEAVHLGNTSAVGLSTLAGFLASISFKLLE